MFAQEMWLFGVVSAEVEERERLVVNHVHVALYAQGPAIEVPVGHVVTGVTKDVGVEDAWDKVDPTLVHEPHGRNVHKAFAEQSLHPEPKEFDRVWPEADETQIVDSG